MNSGYKSFIRCRICKYFFLICVVVVVVFNFSNCLLKS